jgi:hypothetical protein
MKMLYALAVEVNTTVRVVANDSAGFPLLTRLVRAHWV